MSRIVASMIPVNPKRKTVVAMSNVSLVSKKIGIGMQRTGLVGAQKVQVSRVSRLLRQHLHQN